tara:strand:+ start:197 stop:427 length:231 start_codon:yes stop_codon:yes gene_type:complete
MDNKMTRKSNEIYMTGQQRDVGPRGPGMYPWNKMLPGDWFHGKCNAKVTAHNRSKIGDAVYKAVTKDGQNIVVRVS